MELVYLWVEDYKNIHKQGFNFSPQFECKFYDEYDEKGNLKDNCKLEIKPKEHIENFFGKNINITAIVGKNGSGKSSLLEVIIEWNFNMICVYIKENTLHYYSNIPQNIEVVLDNQKKIYYKKYDVENILYLNSDLQYQSPYYSQVLNISQIQKDTVKNYLFISDKLRENIKHIRIPFFPEFIKMRKDDNFFQELKESISLKSRETEYFYERYIRDRNKFSDIEGYILALFNYELAYSKNINTNLWRKAFIEKNIDSIKKIENNIKLYTKILTLLLMNI